MPSLLLVAAAALRENPGVKTLAAELVTTREHHAFNAVAVGETDGTGLAAAAAAMDE